MGNFSIIIIIFVAMVCILAYLYINIIEYRNIISSLASIMSSMAIASGVLSYYYEEQLSMNIRANNDRDNYIKFISGSLDNIDAQYIASPKELHSLYYEFYGYNNFPQYYDNVATDTNNTNNKENLSKSNPVTPFEYITILKIIQYISIMFVVNNDIFSETHFRNRILNFTQSPKLKYVLSHNKNNFSADFISKLVELKILQLDDMDVSVISIPKINKIT